MCHPQINPFLRDLQLQCPTTIVSYSPIEMDGESLDRLLSSCKMNAYTAILFYASWCPFSRNMLPKFDSLAAMYPQIKHVKLEQSSAMPSVFSRHGIHSVPTLLIANRTSRVQYHGPKDLHSLLDFYQITTGLEYAFNFTEEDQLDPSLENSHSWNLAEPYLVFSLVFVLLKVLLKALLFLCSEIESNVISLWVTYILRLILAIFGESKRLLAHARQLFDVKSAFNKLKLSKTGSFIMEQEVLVHWGQNGGEYRG